MIKYTLHILLYNEISDIIDMQKKCEKFLIKMYINKKMIVI